MVGQTIANYTILEKLGEGGMGVVYKARDNKLDRVVALKFLPERLRSSEQDKARFTLEAKAASSLNHPNVCIIHDIQDHDGHMFIVMEYVDGATLRTKNPVAAVTEAVSYAVQIGEALQEAHSKGIVHRDIKADNIMINGKNQVKVMDFGLAKLKGTMKLTRTSSTVGTLSYMAPEQISGGEVDARSDIFSFGVVLYEMLAGRTPFRGDHEAAMVYSIVNEEPEPILKHRPDLPSELLHVIGRSLEKDPNDRYQSVGEMVIDLRRLKKESTKVSRVMPVQQQPAQQQPSSSSSAAALPAPKSSTTIVWIGAAALLVILAAAGYLFLSRQGQQAPADASAHMTLNPNMTLRVLQIPISQASYPGMSSDGNWISFPGGDRDGRWDIYYMHTSGTDPKRITNDSAGFNQQVSDISPDGSLVAYTQINRNGARGLYVVSSLGGNGRRIAENAGNVRWRPDAQRLGFVIFHQTPRFWYELWSIRPDGGDARMEFADSIATGGRYSFAYSPDGQSVAWIRSYGNDYQEVFTHELATGKERQLTFDKKNVDDVCWLRNGMILYSSNKSGNTNLWVVPVEGGASQQVTKGSGPDIGITASADAKKVLYLQQQPVGYIWIASTHGQEVQQLTFEDRDISSVAISPDKKRIAFIMADPDPLKKADQLYMQDRDGSNRNQITSDASLKINVTWSPNGRLLACGALAYGQPQDSIKLLVFDAQQPGTPRVAGLGTPIRWIDDSSLVTIRAATNHFERLWVTSSRHEPLYLDSTYAFPTAKGNKLFYFDDRKGHTGAWLTSASSGGAASIRVANDNDNVVAWNDDVIYLSTHEKEWWMVRIATGARERISPLYPGLSSGTNTVLTADGQDIIFVSRRLSGKLVMIDNMFQ